MNFINLRNSNVQSPKMTNLKNRLAFIKENAGYNNFQSSQVSRLNTKIKPLSELDEKLYRKIVEYQPKLVKK